MKKFEFDDFFEMGNLLRNGIEEGEIIYTILFYEEACKLVHSLLLDEDVNIVSIISLTEPAYNGYEKEYYVILDGDLNLYVEPAFDEKHKRYKTFEASHVFVWSDASSATIINHQEITYEFSVKYNTLIDYEHDYEYDDDDEYDDYICEYFDICSGDCDTCVRASDINDGKFPDRINLDDFVHIIEHLIKK